MIILVSAILGVLYGAFVARRRKGTLADILQYAAVYGLAFTLVSLFITLILRNIIV